MKKVMTVKAVMTTVVKYVGASIANWAHFPNYLNVNAYLSSTFAQRFRHTMC